MASACNGDKGYEAVPNGPRVSVTALVAASAKDAIGEITERFRAETGLEIKISSGPSQALAAQIIAGAPGDVFLSASQEWADEVGKKGQGLQARPLLSNSLVIVVPRGNPGGVNSPADLTAVAVKRVALAGENVPAGKYAEEALRSVKVLDQLETQKKIVRGHDVRSALMYVERGEAEAGVVYSTDAAVSPAVEAAYTFEAAAHEKIVYPLVLLKAAEENAAARRFYDYLASKAAREVFAKHGFIPL